VWSILWILPAGAAQHVLLSGASPTVSAEGRMALSVRGGLFAAATRMRPVELPAEVGTSDAIAPGDELIVPLFRGVSYTAVVDRVSENIQGTVSIRARIPEFPFSALLLSTRGGRSLMSLEIPERAETFAVVRDAATQEHVLLDLDASKIDELEGGPSIRPPRRPAAAVRASDAAPAGAEVAGDPYDPVAITLMIVYTPAAETAAELVGGIDLVIAQAMERAQLTLDNSGVIVTMPLVHFGPVVYTESGDSEIDLDRLQDPDDGYMDIVQTWRDTYGADIVTLLADVDDVGGVGYLLTTRFGDPDYAFNLNRVQQAHSSYTVIHEIGHNMGCSHHKQQLFQPGPTEWDDWPENVWSAGWRWLGTNSTQYCSTMTYEAADAFADDIPSIRIAYFSNPLISYEGKPTGHPVDGDNARTIREMKAVIAGNRAVDSSTQVTVSAVAIPSFAGTVTGSGQYAAGANIVLSATGLGVWTFSRWNDGNTAASRTVSVPSNDVAYIAYFTRPDVFLPGPVTLVAPLGGGAPASNPPTLQWTAPTPEALWYFVEVYRNGNLYLQNSVEAATQWLLQDSLPPGDYRWKVRPWNTIGNGYWTEWGDFSIESTLSPTPSGRSVLSVYHPESGVWNVHDTVLGDMDQFNWGWSETTPVPGDYDGDAVTDPAVYHAAGGKWYILDGATGTAQTQDWGWSEAIPVPGDYDGDGTTDLAVYDPAAGDWYIRKLDGTVLAWAENWGWSKAVPVPGDYDGDGTTDLAVYDPAAGDWYLRKLDGTVLAWAENWGWSKAVPVPGDYDGDGTTDLAVYDPAAGDWYLRKLDGTVLAWAENWGGSTAFPTLPQYWINRFFGLE
jgi:GNAT superfamily N-acetyltransferase